MKRKLIKITNNTDEWYHFIFWCADYPLSNIRNDKGNVLRIHKDIKWRVL